MLRGVVARWLLHAAR